MILKIQKPCEIANEGLALVVLGIENTGMLEQVRTVIAHFADEFPDLTYYEAIAESPEKVQSLLAEWHEIEIVSLPCCLFWANGKYLGIKVEGANPPALLAAIRDARRSNNTPVLKAFLRDKSDIVLFQEGPPTEPQTEEQANIIAMLVKIGCPFQPIDFNDLNSDVKHAVEAACGYGSPPILRIKTKFIAKAKNIQMAIDSGEIQKLCKDKLLVGDDWIKNIVKSRSIMVIIKGTVQEPFCRFTKELLIIMASEGITNFGYFNVFDSDKFREGIKALYKWPTFPQLYVRGTLVGGIDVVKQIIQLEGALKPKIDSMLNDSIFYCQQF